MQNGGRRGRGRGGRGRGRSGGSTLEGRPAPTQGKVMRVAGKSEMSQTAGAIAWRSREEKGVVIEAAGSTCMNIAAKALCIARSMLVEDKLDIRCIPEFYSPAEHGEDSGLNTVLRITCEVEDLQPPQTKSGSLVRTSTNSDARKVAGAIAANVRLNEPCAVSAGGRHSINVAIKALTITRSYLEEDDLDISFQPCFPFAESSEVHFVVHTERK